MRIDFIVTENILNSPSIFKSKYGTTSALIIRVHILHVYT